ncbi:hypothetical protein [Acidovorax sp. NB1]|uniref:hypothetical protein n=1 Tax=Acidovorax sp. NB1 TaxID=1943571 RepID=UPI00148592E0|nr:hypothetical protein [Acidovorax sp. NB1]
MSERVNGLTKVWQSMPYFVRVKLAGIGIKGRYACVSKKECAAETLRLNDLRISSADYFFPAIAGPDSNPLQHLSAYLHAAFENVDSGHIATLLDNPSKWQNHHLSRPFDEILHVLIGQSPPPLSAFPVGSSSYSSISNCVAQ